MAASMRAQPAAASRMAAKQMVRALELPSNRRAEFDPGFQRVRRRKRESSLFLKSSVGTSSLSPAAPFSLRSPRARCCHAQPRSRRSPPIATPPRIEQTPQNARARPPSQKTHHRRRRPCPAPLAKTRQQRRPAAPVRAAAVAEPAAAAANGKALGDARPVFPFTAIVGQEEMKLALLLNVLDPKIGGVMVMGDRGTGKSTTIRALADLLPEMPVIAGDPFNSHPEDPELMSEEVG